MLLLCGVLPDLVGFATPVTAAGVARERGAGPFQGAAARDLTQLLGRAEELALLQHRCPRLRPYPLTAPAVRPAT